MSVAVMPPSAAQKLVGNARKFEYLSRPGPKSQLVVRESSSFPARCTIASIY